MPYLPATSAVRRILTNSFETHLFCCLLGFNVNATAVIIMLEPHRVHVFRCIDAWSPPHTLLLLFLPYHCYECAGLSIWTPPTTCFTPTEGESSSWCSLVRIATVRAVVLKALVAVVLWEVCCKSKPTTGDVAGAPPLFRVFLHVYPHTLKSTLCMPAFIDSVLPT